MRKRTVLFFVAVGVVTFVIGLLLWFHFYPSFDTNFPKTRNYPEYVKGVWSPSVQEYPTIAGDVKRMKEDNINTISISVRINSFVPSQENKILALVGEAKNNGLAVHLVADAFSMGPPDPKAFSDTDLDNFIPKVQEWTAFAEEYGIEYFTPLNEADLNFCTDRAIAWHSRLLPELRKVYTGKILTKWIDCNQPVCTGRGSFECGSDVFIEKIKASSDYDGVIFDIFAPVGGKTFEEFYGELEKTVSISATEAHKMGLDIWVGEFGAATSRSRETEGLSPGPVVSVAEQLEFTARFIDIVKPYYDGLIYGAWITPDYGMKDRPVEEVIKSKFKF